MLSEIINNTVTYAQINKKWIIRATAVFFGSAVIFGILAALAPARVEELFYGYFAEIEQIGEQIFSSNPLMGTIMLFWNNFTATLVMIVLGVILALPTLFALAINGGALGVLVPMLSLQGENVILMYLFGIVPHGIFEIPAILIAGGLGIKIGTQLLVPPKGRPRLSNLMDNFRQGVKLLPGIIILLAVAAVVEIFVTPLLMGMTVGF